MNFVLKERLQWKDLTPRSSIPFSEPSDVKILYNDWPYGVDRRIVHLVIWTKFDLEDDAATDDLTPKARREINDYVDSTFGRRVQPDNVWFSRLLWGDRVLTSRRSSGSRTGGHSKASMLWSISMLCSTSRTQSSFGKLPTGTFH